MSSGSKIVHEIAAGAGVGVGVVGQEKPEEEENPEGEEGSEEEPTAAGKPEEKETPTKESLVRKMTTTMKITKSQLKEMVVAKIKKTLMEAVYRDSPYSIFLDTKKMNPSETTMDKDSYLAMRLAQAGFTPADAPKLVELVKRQAMEVARADADYFAAILKSSLKQPQWQQFGKKTGRGR